jgi:hypothetical protein
MVDGTAGMVRSYHLSMVDDERTWPDGFGVGERWQVVSASGALGAGST